MLRALVFVVFLLAFVTEIESHPVDFIRRFSASSSTEKSWIWGWAWGAESEVSVVDRSPPLTFASRPATFGPDLSGPLLGYVIPLSSFTRPCDQDDTDIDIDSNLGCPKLCVVGPHEPERNERWIALVQRGDCPFVAKVREAQRLGAAGAVVGGDSANPDGLVNMYSQEDASDISIISTYIKYSDYTVLSSLIATSNTSHSGLRTLSLLITSDYSSWEWYSPILTFMIILLLPSSLTFATLLIHRVRATRAAQRDRAPEDIVRNLPWRVWTGKGWEKHQGPLPDHDTPSTADVDLEEGSAESEDAASSTPVNPATLPWFETQLECAICLSEFEKGDRVRVLPCHHIFHVQEVDEWLIHRKKLCPVCKADVTRPRDLEPHSVEQDARAAAVEELASEPEPIPLSSTQPSRTPSPISERTPLLPHNANTSN
ncbi:hypothetical protein PLICRDRAFT_50101 [Plicaturopsis crispa FD-325 SS-3]|nr:hypothetical protein PLICRDRAFT_50101 [Plicaturopsis crispa FD-325 SS-3]